MKKGLANGLTNYGDREFALFLRRSFARSMGQSEQLLDAPVVGIAATGSGFNNCHRAMPELVEAVSRGVLAEGGMPRVFPTISLGEVFLNPTSMKFRNLMAMDTEEMIRAQPMDAVVLIGGCDKTVPAQLMGALSADIPAVQVVTGPMSTGRHKGERLGACTDCRRFWARFRGGDIDSDEIETVEGRLATTAGTCAVMGTASSMACIAETLGIALQGSAAIPGDGGSQRAPGHGADQKSHPPQPDHHGKSGGECAARADGDRRLDQCHHPSHRHCRPRRDQGLLRQAERDLRRNARAGGSQARG
jgi:dihydroxy-acid dehydratase